MKIFKNKIISDSSLICRLEDLRYALTNVKHNNIIFMNLESFYKHIAEFAKEKCDTEKSIEELVNIIEPYIPLVVTDKNIEAFLNAAVDDNEDVLKQMENTFVQNSKIKFIQSVIGAQNAQQWHEIVDVCRTIRAYKEEGIQINSYEL